MGALMDKTRKYKLAMNLTTFIITLGTIGLIVGLKFYRENESIFIGWMQVLGFFCTAYIPLCLSFAAELTFPLEPALVNGTLTLTGSAAAFILSLVGAFMNHEGKDDDLLSEKELIEVRLLRTCAVLFILCGSSFISFILSFFVKEDLKRYRYSEQQR